MTGRILYDGFIYGMQQAGGVNRYFAEIISRIPESNPVWIYGRQPEPPVVPSRSWKRVPALPSAAGIFAGAATSAFSVVHPTYYHLTPPLDFSRIRAPVVVTVHDFVMDRYKDRYERSQKLIGAQKEAIERADRILCVSHSTAADLVERFPSRADLVSITHLGCSATPPASPPPRNPETPFFLYVGSRVFYKNFDWAVEATRELRRRGIRARLLVAGAKWTPAEEDLLKRCCAGDFVSLLEYPQDSVLANLYAAAEALVYPSDYEGFGLPPLEAMACGCPVIAQRASSLPEVLGEAGFWLEPGSATATALADQMQEAAQNPRSRAEKTKLGIGRAAQFQWEKTARETLAVYRAAAGERG